jgi:hypothetical protein
MPMRFLAALKTGDSLSFNSAAVLLLSGDYASLADPAAEVIESFTASSTFFHTVSDVMTNAQPYSSFTAAMICWNHRT